MRKHLILFLLAFIGVANRSAAQETQATQWLTDSSKAIQFGIGNNFDVQAFDSKSISFKTHLSNLTAIRIALSISGSSSKRETTADTYINDTLVSTASGSSSPGSLTAAVSTHFLWYIDTESDVFLFLGAGPLAEYSHSYGSYTARTWSAGIGGVIGVEWFATRRIAFHAEYQAAGRYTSTRNESSDDRNQGIIINYVDYFHSWHFDSRKVLFGLSVYI